jgi:hypothetical protein
MSNMQSLRDSIKRYYDGQRIAAIVGGFLSLTIIIGAVVMFDHGGSFLRGLGVVIALTALLIGGSGVSLMFRDQSQLLTLLKAEPQTLATETARMATVVSNYKYYRIGFIVLAVIAMLLAVAGRGIDHRALLDGIALGLLLTAVLGLLIDHFDREGATTYLVALQAHHTTSLAVEGP